MTKKSEAAAAFKIVPKEEAAWTKIKEAAELEMEQNKRAIILGKAIIKLAGKMIEKEKME